MLYKDKISLSKRALELYNQIMPELYKTYRQYDPLQIRQQFAQTILTHVFAKNCENLRGKKQRLQLRKLRREAKQREQVKKELDSFLQI